MRPGVSQAASAWTPSPVRAETGRIGAPLAMLSAAAIAASRSGQRSAFVEHDHRLGAALPGRTAKLALEPADIEVGVEGCGEKGDIDVGGDHLLAAGRAGRPAGEGRAAGENVVEDGARITGRAAHRRPIADGGKAAGLGRAVKAARELGVHLAGLADETPQAAVLSENTAAGRREAGCGVVAELTLERFAPAIEIDQGLGSFESEGCCAADCERAMTALAGDALESRGELPQPP